MSKKARGAKRYQKARASVRRWNHAKHERFADGGTQKKHGSKYAKRKGGNKQ